LTTVIYSLPRRRSKYPFATIPSTTRQIGPDYAYLPATDIPIRREQNFAILKIDSDQLKLANETFSRLFGDETIRHSASLVSRQFENWSGSIKVLHELSSLPVNELMAIHPVQLKERISRQFGGGRISQAGLNILSMIEQISVHNWLRNPHSADAPDGTDETAAGTENTTLRQIVNSYNSCFKPKRTS
jgi:hypothetical protein